MQIESLDELPDLCVRGALSSVVMVNGKNILAVGNMIYDPLYHPKYIPCLVNGEGEEVADYYEATLKDLLGIKAEPCSWCT